LTQNESKKGKPKNADNKKPEVLANFGLVYGAGPGI
jgi:hypothetical protein